VKKTALNEVFDYLIGLTAISFLIILPVLIATGRNNNVAKVTLNTSNENTEIVISKDSTFFTYKSQVDNQIYFRIHERIEMGYAMMTSSYDSKMWKVFSDKSVSSIIQEIKANSGGDCDDRSVTAYIILNQLHPNENMWINIGFADSYEFNGDYAVPNHAWLTIDDKVKDMTLDDNIRHIDIARVRINPNEWRLDIEYNCNNMVQGYKDNVSSFEREFLANSTVCYDGYEW